MARQLGMAGKKSPDLGFRVVEYGESLVNGWLMDGIDVL